MKINAMAPKIIGMNFKYAGTRGSQYNLQESLRKFGR
jgi:hypothetical protein